MPAPISLDAQRWLGLCSMAEASVHSRSARLEELVKAAGRLTTVHPLPYSARDQTLLTAFRWDCTAFGLASDVTRPALAPGLLIKAALVRSMLIPGATPPQGVALPVPEAEPPAWARRADIGG
jgi:hypothetical protein